MDQSGRIELQVPWMPIIPNEATSTGVRKGSAPHPPPHGNTQLVTGKQLTIVTNRPTNTTRRGLDYAPPSRRSYPSDL